MTDTGAAGVGPFGLVVRLASGLVAGLIAFTAATAFASGWFVPALAAAPAAVAAAVLTRVRAAAVPLPFQLLFTAGAVVAAVRLVRLAVFIVAPTATGWSLTPDNAGGGAGSGARHRRVVSV